MHEAEHGEQHERGHLDEEERPGHPGVRADVEDAVTVASTITMSAVASGSRPAIATPR